ncbi:MAG: glycerophosphodiester phosphodiesterase [Candidatus Carbobacillus altaicus]|nr:glycerophosphodiester phosphodiesterase [Candidatus Carbobacillus altaicus]
MRPLMYAHRGASYRAPENTMAAFQFALEEGADGIELDVHTSRDGVPVVLHDARLERTTNGRGWVTAFTAKELQALDAGSWFDPSFRGERVPLLEEVLAWVKETSLLLNIELKDAPGTAPDMHERVVQLVSAYGLVDRVVFSAFNHERLVHLKQLAPEIERAILYVARLYEPWVYANHVGAIGLHPYHEAVDALCVRGARAHGLKIRPYTVDDPERIRKLAECGVTAIITNRPQQALDVLTH